MVVILPVGAAEERRADAGDGLDFIAARFDVAADRVGAELREVGVVVRVRHDLVAGVGERLDGLRVFVDPAADDEKGRADAVFAEDVDQRLGVLVAPGGVEGEGNALVVPLNAVDRQLFRGCGCADEAGRAGDEEDQGNEQYGAGGVKDPSVLMKKAFHSIPSIRICTFYETKRGEENAATSTASWPA